MGGGGKGGVSLGKRSGYNKAAASRNREPVYVYKSNRIWLCTCFSLFFIYTYITRTSKEKANHEVLNFFHVVLSLSQPTESGAR